MDNKEFTGRIVIAPDQESLRDPGAFTDRILTEAEQCVSLGATALIADLEARDDTSHEASLDALKKLCETVDIPVIGTEDIRRLEDVKKILYAGCKRAAFQEDAFYGRPELVEEARLRFGADRLAKLLKDDVLRGIEDDLELTFPARSLEASVSWHQLKKGPDDLVPVVVQDHSTDEVLMVAYMNEEAFNQTIATGRMTYYSRSRKELWIKGKTSGHYQYVRSLTADCDLDTILARVRQVGAACHTGRHSCFFNEIAASSDESTRNPRRVLDDVYAVIQDRRIHPKEGSYTNYLFDKGLDKILKKCGEEATEIVIAAKNPNENEIIYEISDLLYHLMVLMAEKNVTWDQIAEELAKR